MRRPRRTARPRWTPDPEQSGYRGPARLSLDERDVDVTVHLDGHLEPLDGHYHWYGRIERCPELSAAKQAGAVTAWLTIDGRSPVPLRLAEVDPWGGVQVNATGVPPYPLEPVEIDVGSSDEAVQQAG